MPLVNLAVIGLKEEDKCNVSVPKDGVVKFAPYSFYPTLLRLVKTLYLSVKALIHFPYQDLVTALLMGVPAVNKRVKVITVDRLRLNTSISAD